MTFSPIALFVYNRPDHTQKTIESLQNAKGAKNSILYIFADGAKQKDSENVKKVRKLIQHIRGFKKVNIVLSKNNKGLSRSILDGVSSVVKEHGRIIVLEDDLVVSKVFLQYMNYQLDRYIDNPKVFSVSGYKPPINSKQALVINHRMSSWGWATWDNRWSRGIWSKKASFLTLLNPITFARFILSGPDLLPSYILHMLNKISVWAVRWQITQCKYDGHTIYPSKSYLCNIGNDLTGVHSRNTNVFETQPTQLFEKCDMLLVRKDWTFTMHYWFFFLLNSSWMNFMRKLFK